MYILSGLSFAISFCITEADKFDTGVCVSGRNIPSNGLAVAESWLADILDFSTFAKTGGGNEDG
ncbi:hypothetical protein A3A05_00175 [Candidatus Nomurabacteria bacterium RIFCSPLOWO2_01_FULL_41_12]|uniref:Uncharacterized protein n=1 Tax=Candidatus Nomurabacteria bacterium RIFCSPLOWO2_01_FULL_41_12 TaxID=1801774 RepID=A0A1F6WXC6_9BACT|nr:MAG: hypothetical protein A3A05_00175 [Candidatus Nomurabacteria bacterium RIFCSPLOWO2_01_FULL_41_12]